MARAVCPGCDTEQALKTDGTFRKHNDNGDVCAGSNQWPSTALAAEPTPEPAVEDAGYYTWSLTVAAPCLYLEDQAWHLANLRMAARKAEEAGHKPTGEGHKASVDDNPNAKVIITYRVPVAS